MAMAFAMNQMGMMCREEKASAFGDLLVVSWEAR
jgi:hypothetical protein